MAHQKFKNIFGNKDSTWSYKDYNVFCLTASSVHFYNIYKDLISVIKMYNDKDEMLWFQSWLNFHKQDDVLKWHDHYWDFHGYISIDPKDTITEFREYSVKNEIGNIYIGPCNREHCVKVLSPYTGERLTLGFDIQKKQNIDNGLMSLMPIL